LWAFGTSSDGLGRSTLDFWMLTPAEFFWLKREWCRARNIALPLTGEEKASLDFNRKWVNDQWMKAHARVAEKKRLSRLKESSHG
jgi:hypothetical protein